LARCKEIVMATTQHRYLLALPRGDRTVFLSWRLLASDAPDAPFHVERREGGTWQRVTAAPVVDSTSCLDQVPSARTWAYRVVAADRTPSETVEVDAGAPASLLALDCPLNPDDAADQIIVGDLCNDGRMGYIVRSARAGTLWFTAWGHDGRPLWEFDTRLPAVGGWDGGMYHAPFLCWDIDGDGRTEFVTHRYRGAYPADHYDTALPGELLVALDAETGAPRWEAPWPALRSRVMMTVGHLHGSDRPASIVVQDETYGDVVLTAVDGRSGRTHWRLEQARPAGHNLDIADLDGDGSQEVVCGGICYNGDGSVRWEAEPFGHTDISKPAKIDPDREGLQIWYAVESQNPGVYLVDKDGKTLFKEPFRHAHYGWIARHTARVPGLHPHTAEDARAEYGATRAGMREAGHFPIFLPSGVHWLNLTDWQRKNFVPVHWDAGPEVVFIIRKENKRVVRLLETGEVEDLPESGLPEGGQYGRNLACVDVIGDYRENIVTLDTERHRLIVLANPTVSSRRGYSPTDQFEYRHDRSQLGSGYYIYLSPPDTTVNSG
jgi:rhamnogalacturonan lyase-like protein